MDITTRFKNKLSLPDENGCIRWLGWKNHDGYGKFSVNKKYKFAHRFAYEMSIGNIPKGKCILHRCDVRDCCNVEHLFLGTHNDNMKDMIKKDRGSRKKGIIPFPIKRGSKQPFAKLTEDQVRDIKIKLRNGIKGTVIAKEYNVIDQTIYEIKKNRNWKHVTI